MTENPQRRPHPEFLLDMSGVSALGSLYEQDQWHARNAADYLQLATRMGLLTLSKTKKMIDFGAGDGGPSTIALTQLAKLTGGSVIALEYVKQRAEKIAALGILPSERIVTGDGIAYLEALYQRGETSDLITAFYMDPGEEQTRRLITASRKVFDPDGHLLITSDAT